MRLSVKWLVLVSLWMARLVRQPTAPVRTSSGWVRGVIDPSGSHVAYFGIPYATVKHRFQAPSPAPTWEGTFDAYNEHIRCIQRFSATRISGVEDCLNLNIYTPLQVSERLSPVMVFIHGGGFRDGSGSPFLYGPQYLISHDIIVVSFNYRLEILGFLCLGIEEAPGNVGLKDQTAALKWVQRNIEAFGGDPNRVTVFGESAGSASVMYHILSPLSEGLFRGAIMQSGSAMSPWSFQFDPLETASLFTKQLGHDTKDPHEIYNIIMKKSPEELMRTRVPRKVGDHVLSENIFVPCVEKHIAGVEQFLTDYPYDLLSQGLFNKVPIIIGFNNAEGYMFVGKENDTTITQLNFNSALPRDLKFPTEEKRAVTADNFKKLYMDDEEITKENLMRFSFFVGDSCIVYPVAASIDLFLTKSDIPVYIYKFSYDGWLNLAKLAFGLSKEPGATHADELFYIFKIGIPLLFMEHHDWNIVQKLTTLWTNFAKYGDPTPQTTPLLSAKWRATDKRDPRLLIIDKEFTMEPLWDSETIRFWNSTYSKYRRKS